MINFMAMKKKWQDIQRKRWFRIASNKFVMLTLGFILWMLFIDGNSFLIHSELNTEIEELEESIEYYQSELAADKKKLQELTSDPALLEKFAREEYWMVKEGEEIYLIEDEE